MRLLDVHDDIELLGRASLEIVADASYMSTGHDPELAPPYAMIWTGLADSMIRNPGADCMSAATLPLSSDVGEGVA